ncbi:Hypothetical protein EPM1_0499 [Stenotrophomonas maltophilia EPM1]|nr:Hypothetical protein EPM1_0499 [Stenotrophomonas maltophilia EPM1]
MLRCGCSGGTKGVRRRAFRTCRKQQRLLDSGGGGVVTLAGTRKSPSMVLDGALLVRAVLRTRQDRGWASCPTRQSHAPGPWRQRSRPG